MVEGDGIVYQTGSRATRGLTVLVTDETGNPVANAAVSFKLPDQGSSGVFSSGLRTEVVTTGADGRATVWGMQWNKTAGTVEIRITAVKDQARAGIISTQQLSDTVGLTAGAPAAGGQGVFAAPHKSHAKWLVIGAIVIGAAAAGVVVAERSHSSSDSAVVSTTSVTVIGIGPPIIGSPTVTVGHP